MIYKKKKRFVIFHNQGFEHVFEEKDLGVILDADLKFDDDISPRIKKANVMAGLICVNWLYLDGLFYEKLFIAFVRPHLEYVQVILGMFLKKHFNTLEYMQPCDTKLVDGYKTLNYKERLKWLDLLSLA